LPSAAPAFLGYSPLAIRYSLRSFASLWTERSEDGSFGQPPSTIPPKFTIIEQA
jgi:hypothetical protein